MTNYQMRLNSGWALNTANLLLQTILDSHNVFSIHKKEVLHMFSTDFEVPKIAMSPRNKMIRF